MNILDLMQENGLKVTKSSVTYEWQDRAIDMWSKLNINGKPNANWFRFFKQAFLRKKQSLLNATYSAIADSNPYDPEKYFYKVYFNKLNL